MKRKITESVIQQIVKDYFECRSPKLIRKKYGIVKSTLYNWVRERRILKRPEAGSMTAMQIYAMERKMKTLHLAQDEELKTPLDLAEEAERPEIVKYLKAHGAVRGKSVSDKTAP